VVSHRAEQQRRRQRRDQQDRDIQPALRLAQLHEPGGKRQSQQEAEQDLHTQPGDPELLEQLEQIAVIALLASLIPLITLIGRHSYPLSPA
jgi:hypothetical protein